MRKVLFGLTALSGAGSYAGFHFDQPLGGWLLALAAAFFGGWWMLAMLASHMKEQETGERLD